MAEYYDQREELYAVQQSRQQQNKSWSSGQTASLNPVEQMDSLATVAPRVINAALELAKLTEHLEHSFGITRPQPPSTNAITSQQPTLMAQLRMVEDLLSNAILSLNNVNQHVNGG